MATAKANLRTRAKQATTTVKEKVETVKDKIEEEVQEVETVLVNVPKQVKFYISHSELRVIPMGVCRLEKWIAEHWFVKAQGVTVVEEKDATGTTK